jgi:predicted patatin/cPLA2 family phospholipase
VFVFLKMIHGGVTLKIGIVCEGGGMRGAFTAGVLDSFMQAKFQPYEIVGVSAGASNATLFLAAQNGRAHRVNVAYVRDPRYASWRSFIRTGSYFGMDFIFDVIPNQIDPFDMEAFFQSPVRFYCGTTDIVTGKPVFFSKDQMGLKFLPLRASCALPFLSPIVNVADRQCLDGGIVDPIPYDEALKHGCDKIIIILTRPRGYHKKEDNASKRLSAMRYSKYPKLVEAMERRARLYNHKLAKVEELEAQGIAYVIAPPKSLPVDRLSKDYEKLSATFKIGVECGTEALETITTW